MISKPADVPSIRDREFDVDVMLVAAAIRDPAEFTALYDRYADRVFRFALEQTRSPSEADDITSETMIRAIESLHRFNPERGSFAVWLFAIARNRLRIHFRAHKRMWRAVSRLWEPETGEDALTGIIQQEEAGRVRAALSELSHADREILLLRYSGGLSSQEISEVLNISDDAARTRLSRARKHAADILGDSDG